MTVPGSVAVTAELATAEIPAAKVIAATKVPPAEIIAVAVGNMRKSRDSSW